MKRWSGAYIRDNIRLRADLNPSLEFAHDNAELGAALNGFSLSEQGHLAAAIEKTGQAIDATYMNTNRLVTLFSLIFPLSFVDL